MSSDFKKIKDSDNSELSQKVRNFRDEPVGLAGIQIRLANSDGSDARSMLLSPL